MEIGFVKYIFNKHTFQVIKRNLLINYNIHIEFLAKLTYSGFTYGMEMVWSV